MKIGGTLGLTGNYKVESTHAYQGLKLLADYANNNSIFKTVSGDVITMELNLTNDFSSEVEVVRQYKEMVESGAYNAFVGPYSSALSMNASKHTSNKSVMVLHQASSPSVYEQGFENVFSVNVMAGDYFVGGLELLRQVGAKTVVFAQGSSPFHKALCDGAISHAAKLGYDILTVVSISGSDITAGIRTSLKFSPDVFVGCGHLYNAIQLAVTSRALMFNPKAMLVAQATSQGFVDAVKAPNANYVMGPVTWDKSLRDLPACSVFGSPLNFAKLYEEHWGMEPTYHSAQAAAAGIALMEAASRTEKEGPPTTHELTQLLYELEVHTFFGFLNFSKNGTRVGVGGRTQQLWPVSLNSSREERYKTLDIVLLDVEKLPKYPMPSWEQRELEIYPCDFGYVLNRSDPEKPAACQICPRGTYRNKASLICRHCPPGKYGLEPGLEECHTCEVGMDCGLTQAASQLTAAKGYFLVETREEPLFVPCEPSFVCLEANKCVSHYVGVLCSRCQDGYTDQGILSQRNGVCFACTSGLWNLLGFLLLFALYQAAYRLILYSQASSAVSLTALHTVILRIIFNYAQFASTTVVATGFADYFGRTFRLLVSTFLDPLKHFMSLECLLQGSPWDSYEIVVLLGLFLIPASLLCCFVAILASILLRLLQSRLTRQLLASSEAGDSEGGDRSSALGGAASDAVTDSRTSTSWSASGVAHRPASVTSGNEEERVPPINEEIVEGDQKGETVLLDAWEHVDGDPMHIRRMQWEMILEFVRGKFTRCAVVWIFVLYPLVVRMLLVGSTCVDKDVLRLAGNLDVICHSSSHLQWFRLSVFGLMMYGVGLPSLLFFQIFRVRQDLLNIEVRRNYGFLYNGFKRQYFFFEIIFMARKLLILCAASIPDMNVRMVCMLCCGFAFMGIHIRYVPYDNRDFFVLDRLETTNLIALLAPCTARLFYDIRARLVSSAFKDFLDNSIINYCVLLFCAGTHVSFLICAIWALVRNTFMKHLQLLEECFEERLNSAQRLLLRLTEKQWHTVLMDPDTHELDISNLSSRERHFLHQALCDTMKCYMAADVKVKAAPSDAEHKHQFYVGFMIAALRRAYKRVETARLRRAHNFLQLLDEEMADNGASSRGFTTWVRGLIASDEPTQHRPSTGSDRDLDRIDHSPHGPVIMRARRSILDKGITVEELHLALMLSWPDIAKGKEEYFILETKEDRERAFRREVQSAEGTTWKDQSVQRLFHEINLRRQMNASKLQAPVCYSSEEEFSEPPAPVPDVDTILGLEPAAEERDERQALRRHHGDLLVDVLELRAEVRSLQRRIRAAKEVTVDATLLTNGGTLRRSVDGRPSSSIGGAHPPADSPRTHAEPHLAGADGAGAPPHGVGTGEVVLAVAPDQPMARERSHSRQRLRERPPEEAADKEEPLGIEALLG